MVKILKCYLHAKKSYGTLSNGAIFWPTLFIFIEKLRFEVTTKLSSIECLFTVIKNYPKIDIF